MMATLQTQEFQTQIEQIKVNAAEAASGSAYAAGWRPTVGYVCCVALGYNFIIYPLIVWWAKIYHPEFTPPPLFADNLMELILGMLGLGGMRSWEKAKGVAA